MLGLKRAAKTRSPTQKIQDTYRKNQELRGFRQTMVWCRPSDRPALLEFARQLREAPQE